MPAFQSLAHAGQKRQHEPSASSMGSRKRQSTAPVVTDVDGTIIANDPTKVGEQHWMVQWRNPQYKKHKTWDGDGVLMLTGGKGVLYDMDNRLIAAGKPNPDGATVGTFIQLGGKELEVDCWVSKDDFLSGKVFGRGGTGLSGEGTTEKPMHLSASTLKKKFMTPLRPVSVNGPQYRSRESEEPKKTRVDLEPVSLLQPAKTRNAAFIQPPSSWSAHWRKPQGKKHKTWDGDSYVTLEGNTLKMVSEDGMFMGSTQWRGEALKGGVTLRISSKMVELERQVNLADVPKIRGSMVADGPRDEDCDSLETHPMDDSYSGGPDCSITSYTFASKENIQYQDCAVPATNLETSRKKFVAPVSFYGSTSSKPKPVGPLHNPDTEGAVVMKEPTREHQEKFNLKNRAIVPVVIDPILARHLRPHQKEGVKFMYECVMALRKHEGQGCILADEMGMGKTLQTITLIWTLLKQNCYAGGSSAVGKVLIVCPVSLIVNWKKEFHKWLGKDRVGVFTGDKSKDAIKPFINSKIHQVLIIGYEKLRSVISELNYCIPPIGLVVCDEGHRLKSANNKTSSMFEALPTPRRIILSGTPIQNDLSEFHAMADFCNPGLLDDYSTFRKVFEVPILKSRAPGCSAKELEIGEARQVQLQAVARSFVLRRDASILTNYLPPKHEYVVFVTPSQLQRVMFAKILQPETLSSLLHGSMARSLAMIQLLTKLSNSPILLKSALEKSKDKVDAQNHESFDEAMGLIPDCARPQDIELSGKLQALSRLLSYLRHETEEKCIIVSHYTSTLNVIEEFCKSRRYTFLRLDGQTPVAKRQEFVDRFNRAPQSGAFIFLLSAKAGGVGLNLIGASRLCLVDSDWNPSHDLQSMARIHRDGQKRPVFIYRFLTAGTIDEKIYQRQVTKLGLSDSFMGKGSGDGEKSKSDTFTQKDLRDLFTFHPQTACHTHELIGCQCIYDREMVDTDDLMMDGDSSVSDSNESSTEVQPGRPSFLKASRLKAEDFTKIDKALMKKKKAELASLGEWKHINCLDTSKRGVILDEALQSIIFASEVNSKRADAAIGTNDCLLDDISGGSITFLFEKTSEKFT